MADETYHPSGHHPMPSGLIPRDTYSGDGPPTDTGGIPPNSIYIDTSTGDFYQYDGSTWTLVFSSGGGGVGAGLTYTQGATLNPNGSISGSIGDVYHSRIAAGGDGSTWWKVSGTGTTTVWE